MRRSRLFPILALTIAAACTPDIPNPTSTSVSLTQVEATQADGRSARRTKRDWQKQVKLNRGRYRDNGHKPDRHSNGVVTLETRALLQSSGATMLEVSTGSIEDGTSVGSITKVQIKVIGTNGKVATTLNYNHLPANDGYWSVEIPGLAVGQKLQVTAVVKGIRKGRVVVKTSTKAQSSEPPTDPQDTVVTPPVDVDLPPDVAVSSISMPAEARPNMPVMISAVIRELNGDLSAMATCELRDNGTLVDVAPNIFIDAGGTVSCLFIQPFATEGTHAITVAAAGVSPSDWNPANNSITQNIVISRPPPVDVDIPTGTLEVTEWQFTSAFSESRPAPFLYLHTSNQEASYTKVTMNAFDNDAYRAGPWDRVGVTVRRNSAAVHSATLAIQYTQEYLDGVLAYNCSYYNSFGEWAQVCATTGPGVTQTFYYYQYQAGTVTYLGSEMTCSPGDVCDETAGFSWNTTETYTDSTALGFAGGDVITLDISFFNAADDRFHTSRSATLSSIPLSQEFHRCVFDGLGNFCTDLVQSGYQLLGSVTW